MTAPLIDDSPEAIAHHEAGHTLMRRLCRGAFASDARLTMGALHSGLCSGRCEDGQECLGGVCIGDYCIHEMWEDLAGPVAEWRYRAKVKNGQAPLFAWLLDLSAATLTRVNAIQSWRDDLTSAMHRYCGECRRANNTPLSVPTPSGHLKVHEVDALRREAIIVDKILADRWSRIEELAGRLLRATKLDAVEIEAGLAGLMPLERLVLANSQARREREAIDVDGSEA